ncbi:hypothetical protein AB6A40_003694 [Gnathostoma spinigerum]|uniref:Uncharacterized protein n=1 Tax=Gnathostoma spinigerum TaxID=75299 RepID=A0ABD6EAC0_9BILA
MQNVVGWMVIAFTLSQCDTNDYFLPTPGEDEPYGGRVKGQNGWITCTGYHWDFDCESGQMCYEDVNGGIDRCMPLPSFTDEEFEHSVYLNMPRKSKAYEKTPQLTNEKREDQGKPPFQPTYKSAPQLTQPTNVTTLKASRRKIEQQDPNEVLLLRDLDIPF